VKTVGQKKRKGKMREKISAWFDAPFSLVAANLAIETKDSPFC
jgi:hypothetical protein